MKPATQQNLHPAQTVPMPKGWPRKAAWFQFICAVINAILRAKIVVIEPPTTENPNGKRTEVAPTITEQGGFKFELPIQQSGGGSGNTNFLGEWTADYPGGYPINATVVVRGTVNAGYYFNLAANNASQPWNSGTWVQLANNSGATGAWG